MKPRTTLCTQIFDQHPSRSLSCLLTSAGIILLLTVSGCGRLRGGQSRALEQQSLSSSSPLLPGNGVIADFTLTNQDGGVTGLADLRGHVWIADFIFTTCQGPCPLLTAHMANLQKELPKAIVLVSYSVDPDHDTPAVLRRYAATYHADHTRWHFLTGNKRVLGDVMAGSFHLGLTGKSADSPTITHSIRFVLVDKQAHIRGYYDGNDMGALNQLRRDAIALVK